MKTLYPELYMKVKTYLENDLSEKVIGELTGGDRALVSSLEGFEDLKQIGEIQLKENGIKRGDVVICITEGGMT